MASKMRMKIAKIVVSFLLYYPKEIEIFLLKTVVSSKKTKITLCVVC